MKNFITNIFKKRFVKDTIILQFSSVFSTGLSFLASVIYARVLGIEGYANYALIFAFVSLFGIFMNVGTNQATLTLLAEAFAKQDVEKIKKLLVYYIKITFLVSFVVGIIIIALAPFLTHQLYNNENIGQLARVVVITNVLGVIFGMYTIVLQAVRKISSLAIIENLNKFFLVTVSAAFVLLGFGLTGLIFGQLIVAIFFAIYAFIRYKKLKIEISILPSWSEIFKNINNVKLNYFFKFGFLIAVDKNLGSLYSVLPIFILGIFNLQYVAYLKIAVAYAGLPLILIGPVSRLLTVQLPKSKAYSIAILKRDFIRSSLGSFLIVLFTSIGAVLLGWFLIPLVYGREYMPSIGLSYPLLVGTVITGLGVGVGPILRTLNLMKKSIMIHVFSVTIGSIIVYSFIKYLPISFVIYPIAFWLPIVTSIFFAYVIIYMNKKENINKAL